MSGKTDSASRIGVMPRCIAILSSVIHGGACKSGGAHCMCLVWLFSRNALNSRPMYCACCEMQVFYSVWGSCSGVLLYWVFTSLPMRAWRTLEVIILTERFSVQALGVDKVQHARIVRSYTGVHTQGVVSSSACTFSSAKDRG
jgi:hypothetical protein